MIRAVEPLHQPTPCPDCGGKGWATLDGHTVGCPCLTVAEPYRVSVEVKLPHPVLVVACTISTALVVALVYALVRWAS